MKITNQGREDITFWQSSELDVERSRPSKLVLGLDSQLVLRAGRQPVKLMNVIVEHAALLGILFVSFK